MPARNFLPFRGRRGSGATPQNPAGHPLRYLSSLGRLTAHVDPTSATAEAAEIKAAADSLADLEEVSIDSLAQWAAEHPQWVPVLALSVGLSREKLRNILKHHFNTTGWISLAVARPRELVSMLDSEYDLVRLVHIQRHRDYDFGDILVARAGTRATATRAGASGRRLEDEIEAIARSLELPYQTRARFVGRHARSAPCDLAIPSGQNAVIVVAAKGFDSTGSKLTDAVREIEEMADVRLPTQFVMAVIDGIGWKSRVADLRRIYTLWANRQIDRMYSLGTLDGFREDLQQAAWLRGLKQA